ncbi:MAG: hypothetical protein WBD40_18425, partial [Tepidisphaeraceae bacterium]
MFDEWTHWPPEEGRDIQDWAWLIQMWQASRELPGMTSGGVIWPRMNIPWAAGTITTATATTMTDGSANWVIPPGATGTSRWVNYQVEDAPYLPAFYEVVLDAENPDPSRVVKSRITANTLTQLTFNDITDFVTAGAIPDVTSLVGKKYDIIKLNGITWADRWPTRPNAYEHWTGSVTSATTTTLTEVNRSIGLRAGRKQTWAPGQWAGKQVVVWGAGGPLLRIDILGNTADTLTFAAQTHAPAGPYSIVDPGGYCWPGRAKYRPASWYKGHKKAYWTHWPSTDAMAPTKMAVAQITVEKYNPGTDACEEVTEPVFDIDYWTDVLEECDEPDHCKTPDIFKTIRAIQLNFEGEAPGFVEDKDYTGAKSIPNFVAATWFEAANINAWRTSVGSHVSGIVSVGAPPYEDVLYPISVYYAVLSDDDSVFAHGTAVLDNGTTLMAGAATWVGKRIVLSLGWPRYHPRRVKHFYPVEGFIADFELVEGAVVIYDPPVVVDWEESGSFGIGQYVSRPRSSKYMDHDGYGFAIEGAEDFVPGELARFMADNWNDPSIEPLDPVETSLSRPNGYRPDLPYYHNLDRGLRRPPAQAVIDAMRVGTVTASTTFSITDETKDWWGGVLRVESGTATGGSTTTLQDTSKTGEAGAFWEAIRYPGAGVWEWFV